MPLFGQVVVGPPGSGKSTYCHAMALLLRALKRPVAVINLDPSNSEALLPYAPAACVTQLVQSSDVMKQLHLGPNGALIYAMECLEANLDWLEDQLMQLEARLGKRCYVLFDFPGQVELYTHHNSVRNVLRRLTKAGHRLTAVHLSDAHYCSDPPKFVSILLTALSCMLQLEMPHVNVLSKIDLVQAFGPMPINLQYLTDVPDVRWLMDQMPDDAFTKKYRRLSDSLCKVIEDYGLLSFQFLNVNERASLLSILHEADRANGFCFGGSDEVGTIQSMLGSAMSKDSIREHWEQMAAEKYANTDSETTLEDLT